MVPLAAQEQRIVAGPNGTLKLEAALKQPGPLDQQKVFILKYADPDRMCALLGVFGASLHPSTEMRALAVSAPPATMQAIEDAIGRLDVPSAAPKSFDLTVDLVVGSDAENPVPGSIPKDLDSVIAQLKGAFPFKNYRLLDILTLRTREGKRASTESWGGIVQPQPVAQGQPGMAVISDLSVDSSSLGPDGATVHLDGVRCNTQVPQKLTLMTSVDIKEGQKVVLGRMGMTGQQALFVVVAVKVVE
jgi:hypothetical protein